MSDYEIATATARVQENAMRYGPWTKLVDGLDDTPQKAGGEELFTGSNDSSSTGGFVDINLATPENEPFHSYSRGLKDENQLASCIAGLDLSAR